MFRYIRYRLLFSYLGIFASILSIFAVGVRYVFAQSLQREIIDKLIVLGQGISASTEWDHNHWKFDTDLTTIRQDQSLQLFNTQGEILWQQGKVISKLPFQSNNISEVEQGNPQIQTVTLPIIDTDHGELIGYLRVSQSLEELEETLKKLDWGLGIGIVMALGLSGIAGIVLTNQAMQPIETSFQRLQQFTADASHEFRSPLMAIATNVAVSLKYSEGMRDSDQESFEAIANATEQLTALTENLLLLARSDKNHLPLHQTINLNQLLEQLQELYQPQWIAKNISVTIILEKSLSVLGDETQLSRLFGNLIENAIHYTDNNGSIEITGKHQGTWIEIKIQDTGIGIAPEHWQKIFERFWRVDTSRSYWNGGSGLGLAIVKAITENHGGKISVFSQLGKGSCFTVLLPSK